MGTLHLVTSKEAGETKAALQHNHELDCPFNIEEMKSTISWTKVGKATWWNIPWISEKSSKYSTTAMRSIIAVLETGKDTVCYLNRIDSSNYS